MEPKRVIIESPLKGDYVMNRIYARCAMRDSLLRGEAPYASHLLYDQQGILDDTDEKEREQGMEAGFIWGTAGEITAVYDDLGVSDGMKRGIAKSEQIGRPVEYRQVISWREWWEANEGSARTTAAMQEMCRMPPGFRGIIIAVPPVGGGNPIITGSPFPLWEFLGIADFLKFHGQMSEAQFRQHSHEHAHSQGEDEGYSM